MKRVAVILTILIASVFCTACINNFAIQELNNKAQEYMNSGDVEGAISRLQSSIDLDGGVYESRYNLAVAYTKAGKYTKAKEQIIAALGINSENPDAYYTKAVIFEGIAQNIIDGKDENALQDDISLGEEKPINLTKSQALEIVNNLEEANKSYKKYLEITKDDSTKTQVDERIQSIEKTITEYSNKANSLQDNFPQENQN